MKQVLGTYKTLGEANLMVKAVSTVNDGANATVEEITTGFKVSIEVPKQLNTTAIDKIFNNLAKGEKQ